MSQRRSEFSINVGITHNTKAELTDSIDRIECDIQKHKL